MAKVLIAEPLADAGVELLRTAHEVDARGAMTRKELLAAVPGAHDQDLVRRPLEDRAARRSLHDPTHREPRAGHEGE